MSLSREDKSRWENASVAEAATEARRRIATTAATGAKLLNLGELPLAEVPAELSQLHDLEALALGNEFAVEANGEFSFKREGGKQPGDWKRERNLVLRDLTPLSGLNKFRRLSMSQVDAKDISALARLSALEWLDMQGFKTVDLSPLAGLSRLRYLDLSGDDKLKLAPVSGLTALEYLDLRWRSAKDLSALSKLPHLTHLRLLTFSAQVDVVSLKRLPRLKTLSIERCRLKDLAAFREGFESLEELNFEGAFIGDLTGVSGLANLRVLKLAGPKKLSDLSPLARLTNLESLDLTMCKHVRDLTPLADLPRLRTLKIDETGVRDLSPLQRMKSLKVLDLGETPVADVEAIAKLRGLEALNLSGSPNLQGISFIADMKGLKELNLDWLGYLDLDLTLLAKLERLERLSLMADHVTDLSPLRQLKRLRALSLWSCRVDAGVATLCELSSLKELILFGFHTNDPCPQEALLPLLDHLEYLRMGKSAFPEIDGLPESSDGNSIEAVKAYLALRPRSGIRAKATASKRGKKAPSASAPRTKTSPKRSSVGRRSTPVLPTGIREKLDWLSQSDPKLWPFGGSEHGYRLLPPLAEAELQGICRAYRIQLPEDYRRFLLEAGSGGAGPGCGLERFHLVADPARQEACARPFPLHEALEGDDQEDEDVDRFGGICGDDGVWTLADYGCAMMAKLVLNGPFSGQVWFYDPNDASYEPFAARRYLHNEHCPVIREKPDSAIFTFSDWYEHWLDYAYLQVWEAGQHRG